MTNKIAIGGL